MIIKTKRILFLATTCCLFSMMAKAQLKLPAIISDNMVLQSSIRVPIWGSALPGEKISVTFKEKTLSLPNTGMAVTTDIGDARDIHPTNKLDVGLRLALAAKAIAYHESLVYEGPVYQSMQVKGKEIHIQFKNAKDGLLIKSDSSLSVVPPLNGFGIAGEDGHFVWAKARIEGKKVIVSSDEVKDPVAVRYNWADNPPGNLVNKNGLPAAPFRTDNWPAPIK